MFPITSFTAPPGHDGTIDIFAPALSPRASRARASRCSASGPSRLVANGAPIHKQGLRPRAIERTDWPNRNRKEAVLALQPEHQCS